MAVAKLKELLEREKVKYVSISHSTAYTAQEIAASAHITGKEIAKTVMVKLDGRMAMAVLPATLMVEFDRLREATGAAKAALAGEEDFERLFPECQTGAMPPFGNLYGMEVFVDRTLAEDEEIAFNAGTHAELIRMAYRDFERLAQPKVIAFAEPPQTA
ncbi:MAG: YbaK/EbsC family protein [Acidobacteriota bacterium]|nr:YbaK/EbsC family protein [Acidobacteriota bacterium]MDH3522340.1 YbaK/EbsC family protein [Acidobacteriota bacterium]